MLNILAKIGKIKIKYRLDADILMKYHSNLFGIYHLLTFELMHAMTNLKDLNEKTNSGGICELLKQIVKKKI